MTNWPPSPTTESSEINHRYETFFSGGVRCHASVYKPVNVTTKLPTLVIGHGWGGRASLLQPFGERLAASGILVVVFDYRGWGYSDGMVVLTKEPPALEKPDTGYEGPNGKGRRFDTSVREIRGVVNMLMMQEDWLSAVALAHSLPECDNNKVGVMGFGVGAGLAMITAAADPRTCMYVGVAPFLAPHGANHHVRHFETNENFADGCKDAEQRALGLVNIPEAGEIWKSPVFECKGRPIFESFWGYHPGESAKLCRCKCLFVVAENDTVIDSEEHTYAAIHNLKQPGKVVTIPDAAHTDLFGPTPSRPNTKPFARDETCKHIADFVKSV